MSAKVIAQWWAPTNPGPLTDRGQEVFLGGARIDLGDAEIGGNELTLVVDLDPAPNDSEHPFSALKVTGTLDELQEFVNFLQNGIDINRPYLTGSDEAFESLSDDDKRHAADGWLGYGGQ